jgi:hypothetical protein
MAEEKISCIFDQKFDCMKKITALIIILMLSTSVFSQSTFQGTITFKAKISGEGTEVMQSMIPHTYSFDIKGTQIIMRIEGGMMALMMSKILMDNKTNEIFLINDGEKTIYRIKSDNPAQSEGFSEPQVEDMKSRENILGYPCDKYKIITKTQFSTLEQIVWISKDIRIDIPYSQNAPGVSNFSIKGVDGFPLKMQVHTDYSGMPFTMSMEAVEILKKDFPKDYFEMPSGYQIKDFSESPFK